MSDLIDLIDLDGTADSLSGKMIMGVDPGRNKIGWALTTSKGSLILSGICLVSELDVFLKALNRPANEWEKELAVWTRERQSFVRKVGLGYVALGNGTGSREIESWFARFDLKIVLIEEKGTTLTARDLYWRFHSPTWWQKCLPRSLWIPPRKVDDLAAWSIALRSIRAPVFAGET
ncbi:MAG: endonuclease [Synergistaceae bacterium]|jgi:RNase H-fold protein (predicted Holliday junction resolvase)|nr:endonuclease [Synergistaceae bacterium]